MITAQKPDGALPYLMKKVLEQLRHYETLSCEMAKEVLLGITEGMVNESQAAAFMTAFTMRPPTVEELSGFREALQQQGRKIKLDTAPAIDIVGTGGDGKNTFNISTLAAIVTAGCGLPVIKHGNYAATSVSGSSDVLQYLGYRFTDDEGLLQRQVDTCGICFLHAPMFQPVLKRVAHIRRNLGVRTFFNLLGPLTNPAMPQHLVLGVNSLEAARMFHYLLQESTQDYTVLHSLDGYDELSLTGPVKLYSRRGEYLLRPEDLGCSTVPAAALAAGADVQSAAELFLAVLQQQAGPEQQQVVAANAALAVQNLRPDLTAEDCLAMTTACIASGKAYQTFKQLIEIQ